MTNIIIFSTFGALLYVLVTGGIGLYLANEKGHKMWLGFLLGAFLPGIGLIGLGVTRPTRKKVLSAAYDEAFIDKKSYEALTKTIEVKPTKVKK